MSGREQFFGIGAYAIFEAGAEGILRLLEDAAVGGNGAFAGLEIALPDGACFSLHTVSLSLLKPLKVLIPEIRFVDAFEGYIERGEGVESTNHKSMTSILDCTVHRPWPLPSGPWIMAQSWHDLLFAHWPIDADTVRRLIPSELEIDTFEGRAWLGIVPFRMSGVRWRWTPALPWLSAFPELNVRTYVTAQGKPGVWFFSLDAANAVAVAVARMSFHLPYFRARMACLEVDGRIEYRSRRTHRGALDAVFEARYRGTGAAFEPQRGSLEHFLTERYCLYSANASGRTYRGEIHHPPWALQKAEVQLKENTMASGAGLTQPDGLPLLHFARRQTMVAWAPRQIK